MLLQKGYKKYSKNSDFVNPHLIFLPAVFFDPKKQAEEQIFNLLSIVIND